jgi:hypothetical protein
MGNSTFLPHPAHRLHSVVGLHWACSLTALILALRGLQASHKMEIPVRSSCSGSSPSTVSARWMGKSGASMQARQSGRLLSLADTFWPRLQGCSPAGSRRMRLPCRRSGSSKPVSSWRPLRMAKPQTAFAMPLLSTYDTVDREVAESP